MSETPADQAPPGAMTGDWSALLATAQTLANHHGIAFSATAVQGVLPDRLPGHARDQLPRVLEKLGLETQWHAARPDRIDPALLPVVLFRDAAGPILLTQLDRTQAVLFDPSNGALTERDPAELRRGFGKGALLVAPRTEAVLARLDPATQRAAAPKGHWLWSSLLGHKARWAQVALAALGLNMLGLALPIFVMNVYDRVIPNLAFATLATLSLGVVLALLADQMLRALRWQVLDQLARHVDLDVATRLFDHALRIRLFQHPGGAAGTVATLRDFETVREFFTSATLVSAIDLIFVGLFLAVLALIVGPVAWAPVGGAFAILCVALLARLPIRRAADQAQTMAIKRHTVLVESLMNVETLKSLNAEPVMMREWEQAVAASARVNGASRVWSQFTTSATLFIQQAVSVAVVAWGVFLVADGAITIGALIAANILAGRILAPMGQIAQTVFRTHYAFKAKAAIDALTAAPAEPWTGTVSPREVGQGSLRLHQVSFTYPGAAEPALRDLSLTIDAGECVALLGHVGAGKTTIGRLLNGLLVPDSGTVLVDGHSVQQFDPSNLRAGVGYLGQDAELFTGTLRENLVIGRPRASDAEVQRALHLAGLTDFVAARPEGLDLPVGEKGQNLSGGQRQSVALARVLLRRPKILFLDEPTNALDHQTERTVIAQLDQLRQDGVTLILSTHRMALAELADRFVLMDKGRIVVDGPKDAVLRRLTGGDR